MKTAFTLIVVSILLSTSLLLIGAPTWTVYTIIGGCSLISSVVLISFASVMTPHPLDLPKRIKLTATLSNDPYINSILLEIRTLLILLTVDVLSLRDEVTILFFSISSLLLAIKLINYTDNNYYHLIEDIAKDR